MTTGGNVHVQGPSGLPAQHIAVRIDRDTEPVWETEVFPDWLNYFLLPMLSAGQMWPRASEKGMSALAVAYEKLAEGTDKHAVAAGTAARTIVDGMYAPPTAEFVNRAKFLYGESAGLAGVHKNCCGHASHASDFAVETQYSKISINVAFWITVVAIAIAVYVSFFTAGSGARLIGPYSAACRAAVSRILARLAAVGGRKAAAGQLGRVTTLSGATGKIVLARLLASPLGRELTEEMGEEGFIDWFTQRIQIDKGTRKFFDWARFKASLIGAGAGAWIGTKVAGPLSRVTRRVGGFAGRALNTGLNNMIASPLGSFVANAAVYGRMENPFTAEAMMGGFLGGVGRTGTISPFNPDVLSALTHPTSALASAQDAAARSDAARSGGTPPGGDPGSNTTSSNGPANGPAGPAPAGPAPSAPNSTTTRGGAPAGSSASDGARSSGSDTDTRTNRSQDDNAAGRRGPATPDADSRTRSSQPAPDEDREEERQQEPAANAAPAPTATPASTTSTNSAAAPASTDDTTPAPDAAPAPDEAPAPDAAPTPDEAPAPDPASTPEAAPAAEERVPVKDAIPAPANAPAHVTGAHTALLDAAETNFPTMLATRGGDLVLSVDNSELVIPASTVNAVRTALEERAAQGIDQARLRMDATLLLVQAASRPSIDTAPQARTNEDGSQAARPTRSKPGTVTSRALPGTRFVPDGRTDGTTLTDAEVKAGVDALRPHHFRTEGVTGWSWSADGSTLLVRTRQGIHHFRPVIGRLDASLMGRTEVNAGTSSAEAHVVHLARGMAADQVARTMLHEITDTLHHLHAPEKQGVVRRMLSRGRMRETQDLCVAARMNELGYLVEQWQQATNSREQRRLVADIDGVMADLATRGHAAPPLPFTPTPAEQPPRVPGVPDGTPDLLEIRRLVDFFHQAEDNLTQQVASKKKTAQEARNKAKESAEAAKKARKQRDQGKQVRVRKALAEAKGHRAKEARHLRMAERYERTRTAAQAAERAYRTLRVDPSKENLAKARQAHRAYLVARAATQPAADSRTTAMPTSRIAHLTKLTEAVNELLEGKGVSHRYTINELETAIRQNFHKVLSEDGLVLRPGVGKDAAEVRLKLTLSDLVEVFEPSVIASEIMVGMFVLGGRTVNGTAANSGGLAPNFDTGILTPMLPEDSFLQMANQFLGAGFGVNAGRSASVTGGAGPAFQSGSVVDNRSESMLYEGTATWTAEIRVPGSRTWEGRVTVSSGAPADAAGQRVWFTHPHVEPPPRNVTRIDPDKRDPELRNVTVTGMTGLEGALDMVADHLGGDYATVGSIAHHNLRTTLVDELPMALREAVNGGFRRPLTVGGRTDVRIRVDTRIVQVPDSPLVGQPSSDEWEEEVLIDFANVPGGASAGGSTGLSASAKLKIHRLEDLDVLGPLGEFEPSINPKAETGRSASHSHSSTANQQAIHPSVHRKKGPRQSYKLMMVHSITVERPGQAPVTLPDVDSTALVAMQESAAYRFGLPVDEGALLRKDGKVVIGADGIPVLRGDPIPEVPEGRTAGLPPTMGDQPGQLRGAGPALVQEVLGMDEVAQDVLSDLGERGVVPKIVNGEFVFSDNELELASQIHNLREVLTQLSARRMQAGYDQAAQDGLHFDLVRHRPNRTSEHYTVHIQLKQDFKDFTYIGYTDAEAVVYLDIGSDTSGRGFSRSRTYPGKVGLAESDAPGEGQNGFGHEVNGSYSRGYNRNVGSSHGGTQNIVTLGESGDIVGVYTMRHRVIVELEHNGKREQISSRKGEAKLVIAADLMPAKNPKQAPVGKLSAKVLARTKMLHLDPGNALAAAREVLPRAMRSDSPAFHHFAGLVNMRNLAGHREWEDDAYSSETGIRTRGTTTRSFLSVKGEYGAAEVVGVVDHVSGDIKFGMGSAGVSYGGSVSRNTSLSASGTDHDDGGTTNDGGKLSFPSVSKSTSTSISQLDIWGTEELTIETGRHYVIRADVGFTYTGNETVPDGVTPRAARPAHSRGAALLTIPEYDALLLYSDDDLDLPLHLVADAVERFINGSLTLDRTLATALLTRYTKALADARAAGEDLGLAEQHTPHALLTALRKVVEPQQPAKQRRKGKGQTAQSGPSGHQSAQNQSTPQRERRMPMHKQLARLLSRARDLIQQSREVVLARPYQNAMGLSLMESLTAKDKSGKRVQLRDEVLNMLEEVAPEVLKAAPTLRREVAVDFARTRTEIRVNDMWSRNGYSKTYNALGDLTSGVAEEITVRVRMVPKHGADRAELIGHTDAAGAIKQFYRYTDVTESEGFNGSHAFGADFSGKEETDTGGVSASTDLTKSFGATRGRQIVRLQRIALFLGLDRVRQEMDLVVEIERRPLPGGKVRSVAQKASGAVSRKTREVRRTYDAVVVRRIPTGMIRPADANVTEAPPVIDPRRAELPRGYFPESLFTDAGKPTLLEVVSGQLEKMVGRATVAARMGELTSRLSVDALISVFERMSRPGGEVVVPLGRQGARNQGVDVTIEAHTSDMQVYSGPFTGEKGEVDREATSMSVTVGRGRFAPMSGGANGGMIPEAGIGLGASLGEQSAESVTETSGGRVERSEFRNGALYTVRLRVDYDLTFQHVRRLPGGPPTPIGDAVTMRHATGGEIFVTLFGEEINEMRARMEAGIRVAPPSSVRETFRATGTRQGLIPQLTDARLEARDRGAVAVVTVTENGVPRRYYAHPDGSVRSETFDGGFAEAFATLPPDVLTLAESTGLDLRAVFDTSQDPGTFTDQVLKALENNGHNRPAEPKPVYPYKAAAAENPAAAAGTPGGGSATSPSSGPGTSVTSPELPATPLDAAARPDGTEDLSLTEIQAQNVSLTDFGGAVRSLTWSGDTLQVELPSGAVHHVRVTVGDPGPGLTGRTHLRTGTTADEAHVMVLAPRLHPDVVSSVLVHEITHLAQDGAARAAGRPQGVVRSFLAALSSRGEPVVDHCLTPRLNEHAHLSRKWHAATDTPTRDRLAQAIDAVAADLTRRGHTPPPAPWAGAPQPRSRIASLLNWGATTAPAPAPVSLATLPLTAVVRAVERGAAIAGARAHHHGDGRITLEIPGRPPTDLQIRPATPTPRIPGAPTPNGTRGPAASPNDTRASGASANGTQAPGVGTNGSQAPGIGTNGSRTSGDTSSNPVVIELDPYATVDVSERAAAAIAAGAAARAAGDPRMAAHFQAVAQLAEAARQVRTSIPAERSARIDTLLTLAARADISYAIPPSLAAELIALMKDTPKRHRSEKWRPYRKLTNVTGWYPDWEECDCRDDEPCQCAPTPVATA
ncbi:cell envelope integrity protein TolA [Nonomuraea ceibae]|uniref:cell envelope integrity protein TolA n=1 Tax=Nonomuraea ceibae TaxID=1935170 RepID=UPI001C5E38A0|nr:hypothetical protein [Nonomuraea ceibae]